MIQEDYNFLSLALYRRLEQLTNQLNNLDFNTYTKLKNTKLYFQCQQEFIQFEKIIQDISNCLDGTKDHLKQHTKMELQEFDNFLSYLRNQYRNKIYFGVDLKQGEI